MKQRLLFPNERIYSVSKNDDIEELLESNPYLGPKSESIGYKQYIRSEEWKNKAKFARQLARHTCENCLEKGPLEVHHENYDSLYYERFDDVWVLCRECHLEETERFREKEAYLTYLEKKYGDEWPNYIKTAKEEFHLWLETKREKEEDFYNEPEDDYLDDY